jgi:hypothetical protein
VLRQRAEQLRRETPFLVNQEPVMRRVLSLAVALVTISADAGAQRFEASIIGGYVAPSGKEYERVTVVGPATQRVRSTASRAAGPAFGFQTGIAVADSEHWRLEGGMLFQQTERTMRETASDDVDGPYASSTVADGTILTAWVAAMYRPIQSSRAHLGFLAGPLIVNYGGLAYTQTEDPVGYPFPAVSLGVLLGARGALFFTRDWGVQASTEFSLYGFSVADRAQDFANPGAATRQRNEGQREFRAHVGLIYRYF